MPDSITSVLQAVIAAILLLVFIVGLREMVKDARRRSRRFKTALILSLLVVPAMFSTCATINLTSKDKAFDGFGFRRPVPITWEPSGPRLETRRLRREIASRNTWQYIFSAHGAVSMAAAIGVGALLLVLVSKIGKAEGAVSRTGGYWAVLVPLALAFLLLWNFAETYKYGPDRDDELPVNVQPADEGSPQFPPPATPPPPSQPPPAQQSPSRIKQLESGREGVFFNSPPAQQSPKPIKQLLEP